MAKSPLTRKRLFVCTKGCEGLIFRFGVLDECPNCESPVSEMLYDGDEGTSPSNIRPLLPSDAPELVSGGQTFGSLKELMSAKSLNPLRLINESNKAHLVDQITVIMVLLEKGIVTQKELERYQSRATHLVDQLWAERAEEQDLAIAQLRQRDPQGSAALEEFLERHDADDDDTAESARRRGED